MAQSNQYISSQSVYRVHVRDAVSMGRINLIICLCLLPALIMGTWNVGYQAHLALAQTGQQTLGSWRLALADMLGLMTSQSSWIHQCLLGAIWVMPIIVTAYLTGEFWERVFAKFRKIPRTQGIFTLSILFSLCLPPTIPLWLVVLGMSFGVVIAKEIFGGTGFHFVHPALAGLAFLFFAYPSYLSGDTVWVVIDAYVRPTALAIASQNDQVGLSQLFSQLSWKEAFLGYLPGSIGETSTLALMIGGIFLILTRIASWRIIVTMLVGMIIMSSVFNMIGSPHNAMFQMSWHWHLVLGGFALTCFFIVSDPSTSSMTQTGQLIYGFLLGLTAILFRVLNPNFPESIMLAVILGNLYAPLIDYFVIQAAIKRRIARHE